jgi:hypothetical protein
LSARDSTGRELRVGDLLASPQHSSNQTRPWITIYDVLELLDSYVYQGQTYHPVRAKIVYWTRDGELPTHAVKLHATEKGLIWPGGIPVDRRDD